MEGTTLLLDPSPLLVEGSIVHYVAYNLRNLAALVVGFTPESDGVGPTVDLAVFTNMNNAAGQKNFGIQFHQNVKYSENPQPGTWHWIKSK